MWSGDQAGFDAATKTPPAGFDPKNDKSVVEWLEGHCYPGIAPDATPVNQRIATTAGAKLDGLTACLVVTSPPTNDTSARVAIYGRGDDPYDGEGIAIISGGEGHLGDGKPIPVEVRDAIGSAAPITVFKNIVLPRLGTVIAWSENGVSYGLYGRLYGEDRVPELVTLANKMQLVDGQLQLPADAFPAGYRALYRGSAKNLPLISPFSGIYQVEYRDGRGIVSLSGREMTDAEYEATRFFTLDVARQKIGDRDAFVGQPWDTDQFSFAQWRDKSGVVVRLFGTSESVARVTKIAEKTKNLNAQQWGALAQIPTICDSYG